MKFLLLAAAMLGLTVSQQAALPPCAQPCVVKYTSGNEIGGCQQLDIKCICTNSNFLANVACCLSSSCSQADQDQAALYAQQICTSAGVVVPNKVVCDSAATTGAATTGAATTGAATTGAATTGTATSGTSTTPTTTGSPPSPTHSNGAASHAVGLVLGGVLLAAQALL